MTKDISARLLHSSDGQGSCTLLVRRGVAPGHILPSTLRPRILGRIASILTKSRRAAHRFSTESSAPWCQGGACLSGTGIAGTQRAATAACPSVLLLTLRCPQVFRPAGSRIGWGPVLRLFVSAARRALQTRGARVPGAFPVAERHRRAERGPGSWTGSVARGRAEGSRAAARRPGPCRGPGRHGFGPFPPWDAATLLAGVCGEVEVGYQSLVVEVGPSTSNPGPVRIRPFPSGVVCCWKPRSAA